MISRPNTRTIVPSRATLRALRRLALAGSTAGAVGSICTVATITYEVNRRIRVAEHLVQQKRSLQETCPNYSTIGRGTSVDRMMEAAESGEFSGLKSIRRRDPFIQNQRRGMHSLPIANTEEIRSTQIPSNSPMKDNAGNIITSNHQANAAPDTPNDLNLTTPPSLSGKETARNGRILNQDIPSAPGFGRQLEPRFKKFLTSCSTFQFEDDGRYFGDQMEEVIRLLNSNRPIEASERFLRTFFPNPKEISETTKSLCEEIFYANLKERNTFVALNLFNWIEGKSEVYKDLWEDMINNLGRNSSWESLVIVYLRHAHSFELSASLRRPVLRGLISTYRLGEAKKFVSENIENDEDCGLCAIYLSGLWSKSRSVDVVETQFRKLVPALQQLRTPLTEKVFFPVLKAYVESGYDEKAQAFLEEMKNVYGLRIGPGPLGVLIYGKALKSDWDGVEQSLQELYDLGLDEAGRHSFIRIFDQVFLEYFLGNSGEKIRDFVFRAIEKYDMEMDDVLFEHVILAFIQKGSSDMISDLIRTAEKRSWKVALNKAPFLNMLQEHRLSCEMSDVGLWRMFRASQAKTGRASASQRLLNYDKSSFPLDEAFKLPGTGEPTSYWRKSNSMPEVSRKVDNFVALRMRMIHAMHAGHMTRTINLYESAKAAGKFMKRVHVELAVVASVVHHHGATNEARLIWKDAQDTYAGFDKKSSTFSNQIFQVKSKEKALKLAFFNFYGILEGQSLPIKHHLVVSSSVHLITRSKPRVIVRIVRAINKSKYGATTPFDAAAVRIIARASALCGNLKGVRWAIFTGLKRPSAVNRALVVEIYRLIEGLKMESLVSADQAEEDDFKREIQYLEYLAPLLERKEIINQKAHGSYVSIPFKRTSLREGPKRSIFRWVAPAVMSTEAESFNENGEVDQIISNWLEREELENAFDKKAHPKKKGAAKSTDTDTDSSVDEQSSSNIQPDLGR